MAWTAAASAKLSATDQAQAVIDRALQLHGGLGVVHGHIVESLYREVRALRIYEGASEVQRDQLFVGSKFYSHNASRNGTLAACERSLKRLGLDHIDLY